MIELQGIILDSELSFVYHTVFSIQGLAFKFEVLQASSLRCHHTNAPHTCLPLRLFLYSQICTGKNKGRICPRFSACPVPLTMEKHRQLCFFFNSKTNSSSKKILLIKI